MNIDDAFHKLVAAGDEWAEAQYIAQKLEETQKPILSELMAQSLNDGMAIGKAEHLARASEKYLTHIEGMVEARRAANKARVKYDGWRVFCDLQRTQAATRRAERERA